MYARNIPDASIARTRIQAEPEELSLALQALEEQEAHVYYFVQGKEITYRVVWKESFGWTVIDLNGTFRHGSDVLSIALLLHIFSKDKEASDEELQTRYGNDYGSLSRLMALGPKKADAYLNAVKRVDAFSKTLTDIQRVVTSRKPQLVFCADGNRGWYEVYLRVGFSKLYVNRRPLQFFQAYKSGQLIQIQKEYVTLPPNTFDEQEEQAFQYAYNIGTSHAYWGVNSPLNLKEEEMLEMLFLLEGHTFELNKTSRMILPHVDIDLYLDENGELVPSCDIDLKDVRRLGRRAYRIGEKGIELYSFKTEKAGQIFDFYSSLKGIDMSFLSQEVAAKILPSLNDNDIKIAPKFEEKYPIHRPRIEYYVGLENDDAISFHAVYRFGPETVTGEAFANRSELCRAKRQAFLDALKGYRFPEEGTLEGADEILLFLRADLGKINECAEVFVSEDLQAIRIKDSPAIQIKASSGQDWFSVSLYSSGYTEEQLAAMVHAYHKKKKYVRFKGEFILLDQGDESLSKIADAFQDEDLGAELPLYQALKLPFLGAETDGKVKELIRSIQEYEKVDVDVSPEIKAMARPYQYQGIRFLTNLYRNQLSGILSDDMGLGKTLQSYGLFRNIRENLPILVVCPKSLIYNWLDERDKWDPSLPAQVLIGSPKERKAIYAAMKEPRKAVYFVSYDTLRNDIDYIKDTAFSLVLLDEGQYIANAKAQKTKAVKELHANARIVLTGTPVQNSLLDLWSIFDFLLPGYFPPLTKYREQFGELEFSSEESRARLLAKIKPFLLGRKKVDVLKELPDKETIHVAMPMSDEQRLVYESHLAQARQFMNEPNGMMKALAMMTRLRQICITPSLFLEGDYPSVKIENVVTAVSELKKANRRAIVFSSFTTALALLKEAFEKAGLKSESITGKTSAKMRIILADRFNEENSSIDVMLVSLKAGGTGLNLVGADTVFHLDPWWNLAAERQAEDRAHRIGQKSKVTVFKFLIKDSIEEKVLALQKMKGELIDLTDEASLENALTEEDYRFLLS